MNTGNILLLIGGIILTAWDLFMKKWVSTNSHTFYFIWIFVYIIGLLFLAQSFKFKNIAVASMIFVVCNIITLVIVSRLYFKESLSWTQMIGILFGILSIIILESK